MAIGIVSVAAWEVGARPAWLALGGAAAAALAVGLASAAGRMAAGDTLGHEQLFALCAAWSVLGGDLVLGGRDTAALAIWIVASLAWARALARATLTHSARMPRRRRRGSTLLPVVGNPGRRGAGGDRRGGGRPGRPPRPDRAVARGARGLRGPDRIGDAMAGALWRSTRMPGDAWIAMGALAISSLAASRLAVAASGLGDAERMRLIFECAAAGGWVLATAWLVPLAAIGLRALARGGRAGAGDPSRRWSGAFPLGMYAVASAAQAETWGGAPLTAVCRATFAISLGALAVALAGLRPRPVGAAR